MFTFGSDILTHLSFSLAFGVTRRDPARVRRSSAALAAGFTRAVACALLLALIIRRAGWSSGPTTWASVRSPV